MAKVRRRFKVTHPFHPLYLKEFEFIEYRKSWGHQYVDYFDHNKEVTTIPIAWTDIEGVDPFNELSKGRSAFRVAELIRLVELVGDL